MKKAIFQNIAIFFILLLPTSYPLAAISDSQNSSNISILEEMKSDRATAEQTYSNGTDGKDPNVTDKEDLNATDNEDPNATDNEDPNPTDNEDPNPTDNEDPNPTDNENPNPTDNEDPNPTDNEGLKETDPEYPQKVADLNTTHTRESCPPQETDEVKGQDEQSGIDEEHAASYDLQPATLEEILAIIDVYETLPPEERTKPHWQFAVNDSLIPEGYYCGYEEMDETFPYPFYTLFSYVMTYESLSELSINVDSAEAFLNALQDKVPEISLVDNITITVATGPVQQSNLSSAYDITSDLTIHGNGHTLALNYLGPTNNYFRLTGSGNLKIDNLTLVNNYTCTSNFFSLYDTVSSADSVWNAEFTNVSFTGGGLIGQQNLTNTRGSVGNVTFNGTTEVNVVFDANLASAIIYAKSITFEDEVYLSSIYGSNLSKGFVCAMDDIVINNSLIAETTGSAVRNGLFCSENGNIYFYGNVGLNCIQSSTTNNALIKAKELKFWGAQTNIAVTNTTINSLANEYALIYATDIELGKPAAANRSDATLITINAAADTAFFKSPGSAPLLDTSDESFGNFVVNSYATVRLTRDIYYNGTITSTKSLIDGYTNFYFEENCDFAAQALTNTVAATPTAIIRSKKTFDFILKDNALVNLTSLATANTNNSGFSALVLKKPNDGCLTFTINPGASLEVNAYGTSAPVLHGLAPIQILGNDNQPNSFSYTTICGSLATNASNGNGWSYEFSTLANPSGKDTFVVDGGEVNLNANCGLIRTGLGGEGALTTAQYAAFDNYSRNELEILIKNGGYMLAKSNGWRAMSLAGGESGTNENFGLKTINVIGSGHNNVTGAIQPSTLKLEGGQFAIAAESQASLYINVMGGGRFYSNNTQDSNIYTTGRAVYTVSGTGSQLVIRKSGKSADGSSTYSLYGAIFHDTCVKGPLEIYVENGGYMYVESNYGSRAAICAQTALGFQQKISVTGNGSFFAVVNNNTTDASVTNVIQDNALYPIGAIAFAANTSGNIYVENGGSFYAESHNPFSPTIALSGYRAATTTGTMFINNPGSVDIRNDANTGGDIRATALRGRSYLDALFNLNIITSNFPAGNDSYLTLSVTDSDITVYKTNGSEETPSYVDWPDMAIIRSWRGATFTSGNIETVNNVMNGDGSDAMDGDSAGLTMQNSFSMHTYGRIAAGAAARGGCRVVYEGNGGETSDNRTQYEDGVYAFNTAYSIMDNNVIGFIKPGSTFLCWNTSPDGTGGSYNPNDVIWFTGDITLYAIWEDDDDKQLQLPFTGGNGVFMFRIFSAFLLGVSVLCAFLWLRSHRFIAL